MEDYTKYLNDGAGTLVTLVTNWGVQVVGAIAVLIVGRWIAGRLRKGVVRGLERAEIDEALVAKLASGWTLARLDKTMLQVLRCGAYELIARPDVPVGSAISEYVDVAKAFFDDREAKFVNGILDAVAKDVRR